ncbi:MAG: glycoside hydrolase family 3 N-terminal domain-containing protein [Candidatus Coproplasma sp.]
MGDSMRIKDGIKKLDIEKKAPLVTGASFWETAECNDIAMPSVRLSDGPHGLRVQKKDVDHTGTGRSLPATCFPTFSALACSFDVKLLKRLGEHIGREAASQGVSMLLGPSINIKRSPLCGRNFEYFSEDSYLSGKLASAYVQGVQSTGVTACVKHFAVNSREYARMFYDSRVDEQTLRETYLTAFEIAVKEGGAGAVMTAYNKLNGVPCNESQFLISTILRGEWGFDGVVVSDWGGSFNRVEALKAGADLEMPVCPMSEIEIVQAVKDGRLKEKKVDEAVYRIREFAVKSQKIKAEAVDYAAHNDFSREAAEQSMVLLKNNNALPLKSGERVALFGDFAVTPRYQGAGSSKVNPTSLDNMLGAIKASDLSFVGYSQGFKRRGKGNKRLIDRALKLAGNADTLIVCLGLDERDEAEGVDRKTLAINPDQIRLVQELSKLNKKLVAVLCCGSSVLTDWDSGVDALLLAHLAGQAGATAAVNVLTGKINPSGRLAESYLNYDGEEPCAEVYASHTLKSDYAEGIYVGYKYYTAFEKGVKYPFGYGLSYTSFEYGDFTADGTGVRFTVKNTGDRAGATVPQVYVKAPRSLESSPSELKAFGKIFLEAGESKEVFLPFDEYAFRVWDCEGSRFVAGGAYMVSLNTDCTQSLFSAEVEITGENLPQGCEYALLNGEKISYADYYNSHLSEDIQPVKPFKGMMATLDMQASDLIYCKGLTAKIFGWLIKIMKRSKDPTKSAIFEWLRLRAMLQYINFNSVQTEGFLLACNGHLFKGLKKMIAKK